MACETSNLATPPACLKYTSATEQTKALLLLLANALAEIDGGFTINWTTIRTEALAVAACVPTGVARAKAAEVVETGLAEGDTDVLDCDSVGELDQIRLYLTCLLVDALNP